ncbi:zinc-ribbon domain-containing protein [Clostridium sp. P21]|uniref:Zinc-ribbon domain-containing protein n=1 Tax=Clostridium muellerianum TaxID=2716538 RepID=A0A7Y0EJX4_9CLOT|nr:zinc-ribbon domain-containing protein [Clostridium muellerianum]NMM64843.1 zinc-ribbon domain-containing protein [Clostridium muellerianum]
MFFIGIFGIEDKQKEIKNINTVDCKKCNGSRHTLIKQYSFFHIFFIPIFKWNIRYFLICNNCNTIYEISKEKGMKVEAGEDSAITYWDLKIIENDYGMYGQLRCGNCGRNVDSNFEFCPYCGQRLK